MVLGHRYYTGEGVPRDFQQAARLFHHAASVGDPEAQYMMAVMYSEGAGLRERPDKAFVWATAAARQGHADACNLLGVFYSEGYGVDRDEAQAAAWFQKAADAGNPKGAFNLGASFEFGSGVQQDMRQAFSWYRLAAEKGNPIAQYSLGTCHEFGMGVARNPALAVHWYRQSAEQGEPRGQLALGVCYERGIGVLRNPALAVAWYRRAAGQGHNPARMRLADCYDAGTGVAADAARAAALFQQAAADGHPAALLAYGLRLEFGRGVDADPAAARASYREAVAAGIEDARHRLAYMDWDEAAAHERAEAMKGRTLVFNGLHLGMPLTDAAIRLERQLRAAGDVEPLFVREDQGRRGVWRGVEIEIIADDQDHVEQLYLAHGVVTRLWDPGSLSNAEWIRTFVETFGVQKAVKTSDHYRIMMGGQVVGTQNREIYRDPSGYELVFFGAYAFNLSPSTRNAMETGACKPMGSLALRRLSLSDAPRIPVK